MAKLKVWLTAETKQFQRSLRRANNSVARWSKTAKRSAMIGGAAIAAAGVKSVQAFAEQEKAENALSSALASNGDNVAALMPKYKELASEIQRQTTYGDEFALSLAAQIRNLGVLPQNLGKTTKGAIGLAKALNLDANSAARYAALAMNGEFTVLQRYVPALRTATSEQEKHAIVTDLMNKGYQQAQAETDTTAGKFKQLSNALGDVQEGFGAVIVETLSGVSGMDSWTDKALNFANTLKDQAPAIAFQIKSVAVEIKYAMKQTWEATDELFTGIVSNTLLLGDNIKNVFQWILDNWKTVLVNMHRLSGKTWEAMGKTLIKTMFTAQRTVLKYFGDFFTAIKQRDFKSFRNAVNIGDDLAEAVKENIAAGVSAINQISTDLDIAKPVIYELERVDILKNVDRLEREKARELAKLEEDLALKTVAKKAAANKKAAAQDASIIEKAAQGLRILPEVISDQWTRIGAYMGGVTRETRMEVEIAKQSRYQMDIRDGIRAMVSYAAQRRFVFP